MLGLHPSRIAADRFRRLPHDERGHAKSTARPPPHRPEDLLRRGIEFTALFAANDQMAAGAAQTLCRHGLRIPEDVSVVGFDDVLAAAHACPPRTTVNLVVRLSTRFV